MGISIKQLILNTKIKKKGGSDSCNSKPAEASDSSLLSKREKEEMFGVIALEITFDFHSRKATFDSKF